MSVTRGIRSSDVVGLGLGVDCVVVGLGVDCVVTLIVVGLTVVYVVFIIFTVVFTVGIVGFVGFGVVIVDCVVGNVVGCKGIFEVVLGVGVGVVLVVALIVVVGVVVYKTVGAVLDVEDSTGGVDFCIIDGVSCVDVVTTTFSTLSVAIIAG